MARIRRRQALYFAGLLVFLAFFALFLAAFWSVPTEVRLLPGELGRLRVGFPLRLFTPEDARGYLAGPLDHGSELVFRSTRATEFQVELSLFGAVTLRRVAVRIVPERRVVPSGQAIGVLLAAEGLVVVGHRPLRGLDGKRRYPAREAGVEVGDIIVRLDGAAVRRAEDLAVPIAGAAREHRPVVLEIRRAGRFLRCEITPVVCEAEGGPRPMLGLYVEDPAAGVGTLTFYDRTSGTFAALGHRITELGGQRRVWLEGGKIVAARIS
ncbi:MAG: SpoIVB peptidase S55 domain-containing protein, partial [Bacteroidota bacterium]